MHNARRPKLHDIKERLNPYRLIVKMDMGRNIPCIYLEHNPSSARRKRQGKNN